MFVLYKEEVHSVLIEVERYEDAIKYYLIEKFLEEHLLLSCDRFEAYDYMSSRGFIKGKKTNSGTKYYLCDKSEYTLTNPPTSRFYRMSFSRDIKNAKIARKRNEAIDNLIK